MDVRAGRGRPRVYAPLYARLGLAHQYGVSYPTVRLRLDKLIQKIRLSEETAQEPYIALIKRLAVDDKLDVDAAKILISEYKKLKES